MDKTKKTRTFKLAKIPRYLPGSVAKAILKQDLDQFNQHRYRIFAMTGRTDHFPPKMNPFHYLNLRKLKEDVARLRQIDKENKDLLKKINVINRTGGRVDSYNPIAYNRVEKWKESNKVRVKVLQRKNRDLYQLLLTSKSFYGHEALQHEWVKTLERMKHSCCYPLVILNKFSLDEALKSHQSISHLLGKYTPGFRPQCFLEFTVKGGERLGRVIVELYYDHVPVTVQNFVEICRGENDGLCYKSNPVHRIIKGDYMEMGDITHHTGRGGFSIYGSSFPEEGHVLRHTKAGVLSMKRVGWQENNSQFCITFRKMDTLDFKNVVFGHVIKGNDVVMVIQQYGRKIGKPLKEIVVSDCGEYTPNFKEK